jgi:hypothetical protein
MYWFEEPLLFIILETSKAVQTKTERESELRGRGCRKDVD